MSDPAKPEPETASLSPEVEGVLRFAAAKASLPDPEKVVEAAYAYWRSTTGPPYAFKAWETPSTLVPLPREKWEARLCGAHAVAIAMHTNGGALWWEKVPLFLPEDFVVRDDTEGAVVDPHDGAAR